MASIGGLSGSTSNSISGMKGYGGLASGLDRDSLIEGMTIGTRTKIAGQFQKKQLLTWKQEAYRSISSLMINISQKYTSFSSSTNLTSSSFFSNNRVEASGVNSKYVEVSGTAKPGANLSIIGVKQMATDAKLTSKTGVSDKVLQTGFLSTDLTAKQEISNLEGKSIYFKYGSEEYKVTLGSGTNDKGFTFDYSTPEKAALSVNESLKQVEIKGGKNLGDVVAMETNVDGKFVFKSKDAAGNSVSLAGGTNNVLRHLGFVNETEDFADLGEERKLISASGLTGNEPMSITTQETFLDRVAGKKMNFTYNGVSKTITLPEKDKLTSMDDLVQGFQKGLDDAFGVGRIKVGTKSGAGATNGMVSLQFSTIKPPNGEADSSSVLKITSGELGLLGSNSAFGMLNMESNRVNLEAPLWEAGLARYETAGVSKDQELDLVINGVKLEGLTYSSSVKDIMKKINEDPKMGVSISYLEEADKFVMTAKDPGASGKVELTGKTADILFGQENVDYGVTKGQDAIVTVQYAGTEEKVDIVRGSNSFKLEGLSITLHDKFGYDEVVGPNQEITYVEKANNEPIKFTPKTDSEKIVTAVKDFVKDFNELLECVNKELTAKPNRSYPPLTDEQKKEMSEDEIKAWEDKAKEGQLFNTPALRGVMDSLRFVTSSNSDMRKKLESMGITTSNLYSDNGKLMLDEEKLKAAIEENPQMVQEVFTRPVDPSLPNDKGGLMVQMKGILDKYASTTGATKGILIEEAGSKSAPTSMLNNALQKEMDSIDKYITKLELTLSMEQSRYVKQFTTLESLISQMNAQSSWLSQQFAQ